MFYYDVYTHYRDVLKYKQGVQKTFEVPKNALQPSFYLSFAGYNSV